MTREEAIATAIATLENIKQFGIDKWMFDKEEIEVFDMAIEALQAQIENCGDLISKSEVIETVGEWSLTEEWGEGKEPPFKLVEMINSIQSAEAEPKTGEWEIEPLIGSICSECGNNPYPFQTDSSEDDYWTPDYCPNCGAKMGSD